MADTVTARFKVTRVSEMGWATEVEMTPDYAQGRNKAWKAASPAGIFRLTVANKVAAEKFREGRSVKIRMDLHDE